MNSFLRVISWSISHTEKGIASPFAQAQPLAQPPPRGCNPLLQIKIPNERTSYVERDPRIWIGPSLFRAQPPKERRKQRPQKRSALCDPPIESERK